MKKQLHSVGVASVLITVQVTVIYRNAALNNMR